MNSPFVDKIFYSTPYIKPDVKTDWNTCGESFSNGHINHGFG